jgi:hypothetical protein
VLDWIVDLRAPWPAVTDQGQRPTCLSMALTSAHEQVTGATLSAEYLHWASASYPGGRGFPRAAGLALADRGQPPEQQWPYRDDTDDGAVHYGPGPAVVGPFRRRRADRRLADLDQIIAELRQGRWAVVALRVTDAFAAAGDRIVLSDGPGRAGHAVLAVGVATVIGDQLRPHLDAGDRLLCVRNSWGPGWGADGHKLISEDALNACLIEALALD